MSAHPSSDSLATAANFLSYLAEGLAISAMIRVK
jgi:hypothetical protein